jgi:hypothetical protein
MEPQLVRPEVGISVGGRPALLISTTVDYFQLPNDLNALELFGVRRHENL